MNSNSYRAPISNMVLDYSDTRFHSAIIVTMLCLLPYVLGLYFVPSIIFSSISVVMGVGLLGLVGFAVRQFYRSQSKGKSENAKLAGLEALLTTDKFQGALRDGRIRPFLQPINDIHDGKIIGAAG